MNDDIVISFQQYFNNNKKILEGDFSNQIKLFYTNTNNDNIVYSDKYLGQGEPDCSIWGKELENKKFLIVDIESRKKLKDKKYYMLIAGLVYDDRTKIINTIQDKVEVIENNRSPYKKVFGETIDDMFQNLLIECDFIVVHNYGADIPAISQAYNIDEEFLKAKTLDTFVSSMQILGNQEKNFYSLVNLYKNLICYDVWVSEQKKYFVFGTPPMMGNILEIKIENFDYFGLNSFKEHHPLFDALLTFMLFLDIKFNYEKSTKYRSFHIDI